MTMHDELRAKINEWLDEAKLLDYNGLQEESRAIDQCARQLDAILAKYADHVVVPEKPTREIYNAMGDVMMRNLPAANVVETYRAMIQAAAKD